MRVNVPFDFFTLSEGNKAQCDVFLFSWNVLRAPHVRLNALDRSHGASFEKTKVRALDLILVDHKSLVQLIGIRSGCLRTWNQSIWARLCCSNEFPVILEIRNRADKLFEGHQHWSFAHIWSVPAENWFSDVSLITLRDGWIWPPVLTGFGGSYVVHPCVYGNNKDCPVLLQCISVRMNTSKIAKSLQFFWKFRLNLLQ